MLIESETRLLCKLGKRRVEFFFELLWNHNVAHITAHGTQHVMMVPKNFFV
jgi:hypothetical protein